MFYCLEDFSGDLWVIYNFVFDIDIEIVFELICIELYMGILIS